MSVTKSKDDSGATKLVISPSKESLEKIKDEVVRRLGKQVKIAGFREGKAPLSLVEKQLDQQQLGNEFLDAAVNQSFEAAVKELALSTLTPPSIALQKFVPFTQLEYSATLLTTEDIKLSDYRKIKKTKPSVKVTEADIDEVLQSLRQRAGQRSAVKRPAKAGDEAVIDFAGKDASGKAVNGAEGKDYPLQLGSDTFIPGFEANLLGMKAGEQKVFSLTFPKDYRISALKGKKVSFSVNLKTVSEIVLPPVDDKFAASAGPFKTLSDLKADIKKQLEAERSYQKKSDLEAEIVRDIISKSKIPVIKDLLNEQIDRELVRLKQNLTYRGQTLQEFLEIEQMSEEEYRKKVVAPGAEEKLKGGLVLAAIGEKENIFITPAELESRMQLLKSQYTDPAMQAELDKPDSRRDIFLRLLTEKTLATLVEIATN